MASLFGGILALVMSVILITAVVIPTVKTVNSTGWSTSEIALLSLVTIVSLMGLSYGAANIFGFA
jgi:hypothetical protein